MFQLRRKSDGLLLAGTASKPHFAEISDMMFVPNGVRSFIGHLRNYHPSIIKDEENKKSTKYDDLEVVQVKLSHSHPKALPEFLGHPAKPVKPAKLVKKAPKPAPKAVEARSSD